MHRRGAWSCALLLACAVFASQVSAKTCPPTAKSVQEYLNDSDYTVGKALVPLLGSDPFKGTVFLPTNAALNATLGLILELASNLTGTPVTSLPAGVTLEDIFSNPAFVDVLKLHLLPRALDPTQLVAVNFTNGSYIRRDIPTVLSFQDKPNFCTKAKTDTALLTGEVIGTSGKDITGANITGPANSANGVKITVAGICPGVVHIIDAILLPCGLNDSVVPVLAASLAPPAKSPTSRVLPPGASPAMSPSANKTSNTTAAPKNGAAAAAVGMSAVWSAAVMLVLAVVIL